MIIGIGTDITECERPIKIYEKYGHQFIRNILTPNELELMESRKAKSEFLAGRWAAKEAFSKALGCGMCEKCAFVEIEILVNDSGAPYVVLHAETAKTAERLGVKNVHVSISHEKNYAVAMVILEG